MPAYLKPGCEAPVWLESDKDVVPRPTFYARALTMGEQLELSAKLDAPLAAGTGTDELFKQTTDLLADLVVRFENLPDFEWNKLNWGEAQELIRKIVYSQGLTYEEKKD